MGNLGTRPQRLLVAPVSETLLRESFSACVLGLRVKVSGGPPSAALRAAYRLPPACCLAAALLHRLSHGQGIIPRRGFTNSFLHVNKLDVLGAVSDLQKKITKRIQRGSHASVLFPLWLTSYVNTARLLEFMNQY